MPDKFDRCCNKKGDCLGYESFEDDACVLDFEGIAEDAENYDCTDRLDVLMDCFLQTGECEYNEDERRFDYVLDCDSLVADYQNCLNGF